MYKYGKYLIKSQHLSKEEKDNLAKLYYSNVKTTILIEKFGIDVTSSNLYKCLLPEKTREKCPYCKINLVYLPVSKKQVGSASRESVCLLCDHEPDNKKCSCRGCLEHKRQEGHIKKITEQFKNESILEFLKQIRKPAVPLNDLTIKDRLFIAALLKDYLSGDLTIIKPVSEYRQTLSPTREYAREILNHLNDRGIIQLSSRGHHLYNMEDNVLRYDPFKIHYELNVISNETSKSQMIKRLLNPAPMESYEVKDGYTLWAEIAIHEALGYLRVQLEQCGLIVQAMDIVSEKTILEISMYMEHFSTAQMFKIFWSIANSAAAYKQKYNKHLSVDAIVNNIIKYSSKIIDEDWNLEGYSRTHRNPQTMVSSILFNQIFKIGEEGFTMKASRDYLQYILDVN